MEALAAERFLEPLLQGEVARSAGGVERGFITGINLHKRKTKIKGGPCD